jgi:hypothetical protein
LELFDSIGIVLINFDFILINLEFFVLRLIWICYVLWSIFRFIWNS